MKLTVLGNYGPYPNGKGTACSSYLYEENGVKILLDFGSGALANLSSICNPLDIDYIFISHLHFDHTSDIFPFRYMLEGTDKKINIITRSSDSDYYKVLFSDEHFNMINVSKDSELNILGLKLSFFNTAHPMPNLAVRIEGEKTFIYTGDTKYFDGIEQELSGADVVLIDALKPSTFNGPHMKAIEAISLQKKLGGTYLLTHKSHYNLEEQENKNIIQTKIFSTYEF